MPGLRVRKRSNPQAVIDKRQEVGQAERVCSLRIQDIKLAL